MQWKYAMVKVAENVKGESVCALVELYMHQGGGQSIYNDIVVTSDSILHKAYRDTLDTDINTYFYDTGTFTWDEHKNRWFWKSKTLK